MGAFNSVDEAIGKNIGNDKILRVTGKDAKGKTCVDVQCMKCNKIRNLQWGRFNYGTARKCDCERSKGKLLKVGMQVGDDLIVGETRYRNSPAFEIKCTKCNTIRVSERFKVGENKQCLCNCKKHDRFDKKQQEALDSYSNYIGRYIEIADATIVGFKTSEKRGIRAILDCSKCTKLRDVSASQMLNAHKVKRCTCDARSNEYAHKRKEERDIIAYEKYKRYIGKTFGKLTVKGISHGDERGHYFICSCECSPNRYKEYEISNVLNGHTKTCGCTRSFGEVYLKRVLDRLGENYESEVSFDGLVGLGGGKLRYDIALLDKNKKLIGLIEYDGPQHYFNDNNFGNKFNEKLCMTQFEITQVHDKLKNDYASDNNIPLMRFCKASYKEQTDFVLKLFIQECKIKSGVSIEDTDNKISIKKSNKKRKPSKRGFVPYDTNELINLKF